MGVGPRLSGCSKNPNPKNFIIESNWTSGIYTIVKVRYPDCANFEGLKILVFRNVTIGQINKFKFLDPHFYNSKENASPIARFVPTDEGMIMAIKFVNMMLKQE